MKFEYKNILVEVKGVTSGEFKNIYDKVDKECLKKYRIYFCLNNKYSTSSSSKSKRHVGIITDIIIPKDKDSNISINIFTLASIENLLNDSDTSIFINRTANGFMYFYINSSRIYNMDLKNMEMQLIKESIAK